MLTDGIRVTTPGPNHNLPARCGINVMLVLDESGSIGSTSGATDAVKTATRSFLNALSGTGSRVSITDFSTSAARQVKYTTVTQESIDNVFEPYLTNRYKPSGWTNWEAAFQKVGQANTQGTVADLVVFMTDGDPTARNNSPNPPITNLTEGNALALTRAAEEADKVKADGSHVLALGVGAAVTDVASASRLTAVSGFDEYPPASFSQADFTLVKDFTSLAEALRQMAVELCRASVSITKLVDEGDGIFEADAGWKFTASVEMSAGDSTWLLPAPPPSTGATSALTDDAGVANFQWKPSNANAISTVTVTEDVRPGYQFVDANCSVTRLKGRRRVIRRVRTTQPSSVVIIGPNQYAKCTVRNRIMPGTIEIEKNATPESSQPFAFAGSFGDFTLVDDRAEENVSKTFTNLAPGTYTVSELVPEDWELTGITCTPPGAAVIAGPQVTITLAPNASVVCTYNDTRIDPPVPPEPPDPGPEPPTPEPPTPEPPTTPTTPGPTPPPGQAVAPTPPATQLRVVKRVTRVARVGGRIRFRLTVTNTGSIPATNVRLVDIPPAALTLSGLRATTRASVVRGNAVWRLGTLAPGASRTIRGSVVVDAGTPGLVRNLALATAENAQLVADRADTRILARGLLDQRRLAPPVTG